MRTSCADLAPVVTTKLFFFFFFFLNGRRNLMPQEILQGVDTLLAKLTCKVMEKKYKKVEQGEEEEEEEEEEEDEVCRVGDGQEGGVGVCRGREGGRKGWRQGGRLQSLRRKLTIPPRAVSARH